MIPKILQGVAELPSFKGSRQEHRKRKVVWDCTEGPDIPPLRIVFPSDFAGLLPTPEFTHVTCICQRDVNEWDICASLIRCRCVYLLLSFLWLGSESKSMPVEPVAA